MSLLPLASLHSWAASGVHPGAWVAVGLVVFGLLWAVGTYNRLVRARNHCDESWSDVDTELKRRYDLIPNLVETVKGYAKHEGDTLERVVLARNKAASPHTSPVDQARDENALTREIRGLFLLKESYPELKASRHFLALQEELATTENRIQRARRFYNANVRDLANLIESFPSSVLANMYGFRKREFFEIEDASERALPQVDLSLMAVRTLGRATLLALALLSVVLLAAPAAVAGGGPSRTVIVANGDSPTSLYVATEYARMRGIPVHHICRLTKIPHRQLSTVDLFRERILAPLDAWLAEHGLDGDVDTIAFSTDFPFAADFSADGEPNGWDKRVPKRLSLTGATYLSRRVLAKDLAYTDLEINRYARVRPGPPLPTTGFRSTYLWERSGEAVKQPSADDLATDMDRYRLSTMLGWHGIQGMSVPDILANLERSVGADGTMPKGTVYLMDHKDIRAKSRRMFFNQTVEELEKRGHKAVIIAPDQEGQDAVLPNQCEDVIGVVAGIAGFDWSKCGSQMLPGAIAEHLTSFGGQLDGSGQTKLTAFLAAGAAGSSGTVCEPLSIWMKFPAPFIHIHYADGASLAEAFYESLRGPFQLLIVGDPLTRPYAPIRTVKIAGTDAKSPASGSWGLPLLEIGAGADPMPTRLEAYVDGHQVWSGELGSVVIDTTTLEDGGHELHIAAITDDLLETRSESHARFVVRNGGDLPTLVLPKKPVALDDEIKLSGRAPSGVKDIALHHGNNVIATTSVRSGRWKLEIPATLLGRGSVPLYVRGVDKDGRASRSEIEDLVVEAPGGDSKPKRTTRKKPKDKTPKGQQGLEATVEGAAGTKDGIVVKELPFKGKGLLAAQLGDAAKGKVKKVTLEGEVVAPAEGIYQWALAGPGTVRLEVDGEVVFERTLEGTDAGYAETRLKEGANAVEITLEPEGAPKLSVWLGGDMIPRVLGGDLLKH